MKPIRGGLLSALGVVLLVFVFALLDPLPFPQGQVARAAFPGQNGVIAFASDRSGESVDIYKMHPDGSHLRRLTNDLANDDHPDFSPDGEHIVYTRRRSHKATIYVMAADGSHQRRLTRKRGHELDPAFSADGAKIVYSQDRPDGLSDLFVMNADGSHRHLLAHHPGNDWGATYSPSGDEIAYENTATDISVYVMNADGSQPRLLTDHPNDDFSWWPDFSPDGAKIVYSSFRRYIPQIYLMDADGSDQHPLTDGQAAWKVAPVFSPNGSKIAYVRWGNRSDDIDIYVMDADGSRRHNITHSSAKEGSLDWGPRP